MPSYRYEVKSTGGKASMGVISAPSLAAASQMIRQRGEYILHLAPADDRAAARKLNLEITFGPRLSLRS
jgi:type II secretory pathway component PulF